MKSDANSPESLCEALRGRKHIKSQRDTRNKCSEISHCSIEAHAYELDSGLNISHNVNVTR